MNKRMTEEKAKKDYELTLKMEQEFGEYLTGELLKMEYSTYQCFQKILNFKIKIHFLV